MPIPEELTREHVEQAIKMLREGAPHPFGDSTTYSLEVDGERFAPKAVIGIASSLAIGRDFGPEDFSGGEAAGQANGVLRSLGYTVTRVPASALARASVFWVTVGGGRQQNFQVAVQNGIWGVPDDARNRLSGVKQNDFILVYGKDVGLALCRVTRPPYSDERRIWDDGVYPHRIGISPPLHASPNVEFNQIYPCLRDMRLSQPYDSALSAGRAIGGLGGTFRPLADGETDCIFALMGWDNAILSTRPTQTSVWFEYAYSEHDHGGDGWEFGTCLWSPTVDRGGNDRYSTLRKAQPGDLVVHCLDGKLVGESLVSQKYRVISEKPPKPGVYDHASQFLRVDLKDYREFARPYKLTDLVRDHADDLRRELSEGPEYYPFSQYAATFRHTMGAYLTKCTPTLYRIIREHTSMNPDEAVLPEKHAGPTQYWVVAAGEGGRLWGDFQDNSIVAIGFQTLGDLQQYANKDLIRDALKTQDHDAEPINKALACWEFANEMREGDVVFAIKGRRTLLGYGIIESAYKYQSERGEYKNTRQATWKRTGPWALDVVLPGKSVTNITENAELVDYLMLLVSDAEESVRPTTAPLYQIEDALRDLFLEREQVELMLKHLSRKRNLILEGAPGVGKTHIAKRLAFALIGYEDPRCVESVQFHQSYSYEDFVQGWRPNEAGGFKIQDGIFYQFCDRAARSSMAHVFIIDEINRGNLSKIFGELLVLLEADKRDERHASRLTYSRKDDPKFFVPDNVYVIGLMNTADRSLAMVDYALRRRFAFAKMKPAFKHAAFRAYLIGQGVEDDLVDRIINRMTSLNEEIRNDKKNLGSGFEIGHSFFVPQDTEQVLGEEWYNDIVQSEIAPLIREYWFDNEDKASELESMLLK